MMAYLWKDMDKADLANQSAYQEMEHQFQDGQKRKILLVDEEVPYPDGRMIVSRPNLQGNITHANKAFVDISAYEREELIGAPQCILRHPDVPSEIFADMWATIQAGKSWFGCVKNLRKDGRYYWVYASVNPNYRQGKIVAYTSVRRKPSRAKVAETMALIQQINQQKAS